MFKVNYITLAILTASFLGFVFLIDPTMVNNSLSEILASCANGQTTQACQTANLDFSILSFRNGFIYITLGLVNIFYAVYLTIEIGVKHVERGIISPFSKVAKIVYEVENDLDQLVLYSNKAFAPQVVPFSKTKQYGLTADKGKGTERNKFVYQRHNDNGSEVFILTSKSYA